MPRGRPLELSLDQIFVLILPSIPERVNRRKVDSLRQMLLKEQSLYSNPVKYPSSFSPTKRDSLTLLVETTSPTSTDDMVFSTPFRGPRNSVLSFELCQK
jgi:hypothetical protein